MTILRAFILALTGLAFLLWAPSAQAKQKSAQKDFMPPTILSTADADVYRLAFRLARSGQGSAASIQAANAGISILSSHITAESLIANNAGTLNPAAVAQWLASANDLPQAPRLYAAAAKSIGTISKPAELGNRWGQWRWPRRERSATQAEKNIAQITWSHYSIGQLAQAQSRSLTLTTSPTPEAGFALFIGGLAAWRQNDFDSANKYFTLASEKPGMTLDMQAATHFWAARAASQVEDFSASTEHLQKAAATNDTFYGLLAMRVLGVSPKFNWHAPKFNADDWRKISGSLTVQRIAALHQVGEYALADEELRNWWGRSPENHWAALVRFGDALGLHSAKLSLARRSPAQSTAPMAAHYPFPQWWNDAGPAVPKALVFAFMRQESAFRRDTVSRSNARGPMQFLPSTAREVGQNAGLTNTDPRLDDPAYAIQLGKTYLRQLASSSITGGNLLKVVASYNGGPGNVRSWVGSLPENDPLLYIESIPLTETRDYVETVMKNFWMYQLQMGDPTPTLDTIAAGTMPIFPGSAPRHFVMSAQNAVGGKNAN
jgi:soluble lytic murein transglycosylase